MKIISKESAVQAYQSAPKPIKDVVDSGETISTIVEIGKKHNLHVDVFGKLAQLNSYLLLGLAVPQDLSQELIAAGVADKDAREIMAEINQKIFVPLREEMQKGGGSQTSPNPQGVAPRSSVQVPNYAPPPPPLPPSPAPRPPVLNPSIAPLPPKIMLPRGGNQISTNSPRRPVINLIQKPIESSSKLLEDHEEPHIELKTAETPLRQVLRRVAPENLPGAIFHPELPKPPIPPLNRAASEAARSGEHSAPQNVVAAKPYTIDPYHEPIEEGGK